MLPRREFLRGLSALGVFSLAGCSDDGEGTDTLTEPTRPGTTTVPFTVTETLHDPSTATTTQRTATRTTALTTPVTETATKTSTDMVVAQSDPSTDSQTSTATQSTTSTTTTSPTDTMTDQVFWQDGDSASPENLSQLRAQTNSSDYVERGVTFTPDYANNELDISTGHAVIYDESTDRAYDVFPDARTNLALTDAATNYVFLMVDPDNITGSGVDDDVGYHIDTDDTPPTATETSATTISLKVGEVDTTAAATSTDVNRDPAVSARAVDTEKASVAGSGVVAVYTDPDTQARVTEGFDTIQAAIDVIPADDDLGSAEGMVYVTGRGAVGANGDPWEENDIVIDKKGMNLIGSGIHTKIADTSANPILRIEAVDVKVDGFWIDNYGTGNAITVNAKESKIMNMNIDAAGNHAIEYTDTAPAPHQLGPFVEIKDAQGAAVWSVGRVLGNGIIIEEYDINNMFVETAIKAGEGDRWSNVWIGTSGSRGFWADGDDIQVTNMMVRDPPRKATTSGPTVPYELGGSRGGDRFQGVNLREKNSGRDGLRFYSNVVGGQIRGRFPDGIVNQTVGYHELNTINGTGFESANAETPTASSWEIGEEVSFTDTGDGSGSGLYSLAFDGTWIGPR